MQTGKGISRRQGTTLIEVLVALGIATLIVGVIVTTHYSLTRHATSQAEILKQNNRVLGTTRELREDLQNLFVQRNDEVCAIQLENTEASLVTLSFCRWQRASGIFPAYSNRLERVHYTIGERKGKPALLKYVEQVSGVIPEPAITNWVDSGWANIRIELHDGNSWQSSWGIPGAENADTAPATARIQFMAEPEENRAPVSVHESMIIIPAGLVVERSLETEKRAE